MQWYFISPHIIIVDEKVEFLLKILVKVIDEMNCQIVTPEDLIFNNIKSILIDHNDFFFLIDKVFEEKESQIFSLINYQSLVGNYRLRDKLKHTLKELHDRNIISASHPIYQSI